MLKTINVTTIIPIICINLLFSMSTYSSSKQEKAVKRFVSNSARYVKKQGKFIALCAFNQADSIYRRNNRYLFAFVCNDKQNNGFILLDPETPQYTFTQRANTPIIKHMLNAIKKKPNGIWYNYQWKNPKTKKLAPKRSYIVMLAKEKICLGSGYYSQ